MEVGVLEKILLPAAQLLPNRASSPEERFCAELEGVCARPDKLGAEERF